MSARTAVAGSEITIESAPSPAACVRLVDTFPPAAPGGLTAVGTEGAVNLIWEASPAADLAGYLVLRGESDDRLSPVTTAPIADTNFRDPLASGERRVYAVQAVDRAGNVSAAARQLGVHRQSLQQKIRELDLRSEDWSDGDEKEDLR